MTRRVRAWWYDRTDRERRLLTVALGALALVVVGRAVALARADFADLRSRVASAERRLTTARIVAGRFDAEAATADPDVSLVSLVESTVADLLGPERLARLEPSEDPDRRTDARVTGVALADVVRLLAALEAPTSPLRVRSIDLRLLPNERATYDAALVVVRRTS